MSDKTALYRLFDEGGCLLYVGISNGPHNRIQTHKREQPWGKQIVGYEIEWVGSRRRARRLEWETIRNEAPVYNKQRPSDGVSPFLPPRTGGWWWTALPVYLKCPNCPPLGEFDVGVHFDHPTESWLIEGECHWCGHHFIRRTDDPEVIEGAGSLGEGWRPRLVVNGG